MTDPDRPVKPRKRRIWAIALVVLATIAIFATWRATSLSGLPDVGDPFDIAAYADVKVPDDRNAFTLYRHATKLVTKPPKDATFAWATAGEAEKRWLESSRGAMDFWRKGTERPEALYIEPRAMRFDTVLPAIQEARTFAWLASLEGSRLEAAGDMDGALTWYLAVLRCGRHCGTRGAPVERLVGIALNQLACGPLNRWAADPRVTAPMLRRAIDAAIAAEGMTRPNSEWIKSAYMITMTMIDDPKMMASEVVLFATGKERTGQPDSTRDLAMYVAMPRVLKREPERSRRVIRLIFANQLAYCDLPVAKQPPRVATIPPGYLAPATSPPKQPGVVTMLVVDLYAVDPSAPPAARAMPPAEIASWWDSTLYAKADLMNFTSLPNAIAGEQVAQAGLLATLRSELEKRQPTQPVGAAGDRP